MIPFEVLYPIYFVTTRVHHHQYSCYDDEAMLENEDKLDCLKVDHHATAATVAVYLKQCTYAVGLFSLRLNLQIQYLLSGLLLTWSGYYLLDSNCRDLSCMSHSQIIEYSQVIS